MKCLNIEHAVAKNLIEALGGDEKAIAKAFEVNDYVGGFTSDLPFNNIPEGRKNGGARSLLFQNLVIYYGDVNDAIKTMTDIYNKDFEDKYSSVLDKDINGEYTFASIMAVTAPTLPEAAVDRLSKLNSFSIDGYTGFELDKITKTVIGEMYSDENIKEDGVLELPGGITAYVKGKLIAGLNSLIRDYNSKAEAGMTEEDLTYARKEITTLKSLVHTTSTLDRFVSLIKDDLEVLGFKMESGEVEELRLDDIEQLDGEVEEHTEGSEDKEDSTDGENSAMKRTFQNDISKMSMTISQTTNSRLKLWIAKTPVIRDGKMVRTKIGLVEREDPDEVIIKAAHHLRETPGDIYTYITKLKKSSDPVLSELGKRLENDEEPNINMLRSMARMSFDRQIQNMRTFKWSTDVNGETTVKVIDTNRNKAKFEYAKKIEEKWKILALNNQYGDISLKNTEIRKFHNESGQVRLKVGFIKSLVNGMDIIAENIKKAEAAGVLNSSTISDAAMVTKKILGSLGIDLPHIVVFDFMMNPMDYFKNSDVYKINAIDRFESTEQVPKKFDLNILFESSTTKQGRKVVPVANPRDFNVFRFLIAGMEEQLRAQGTSLADTDFLLLPVEDITGSSQVREILSQLYEKAYGATPSATATDANRNQVSTTNPPSKLTKGIDAIHNNDTTGIVQQLKSDPYAKVANNVNSLSNSSNANKLRYLLADALVADVSKGGKENKPKSREEMTIEEQMKMHIMMMSSDSTFSTFMFQPVVFSDKARNLMLNAIRTVSAKSLSSAVTWNFNEDGTIDLVGMRGDDYYEVMYRGDVNRMKRVEELIQMEMSDNNIERKAAQDIVKKKLGEQFYNGSKYFYMIPALNEHPIIKKAVEDGSILDTTSTVEVNGVVSTLDAVIQEVTRKTIEAEINAYMRMLYENNVVRTVNAKGEPIFELTNIPKNYLNALGSSMNLNDKEQLKVVIGKLAIDFTVNYMYGNAEFIQLLGGDPAEFYKEKVGKTDFSTMKASMDEYYKRMAGEIGTSYRGQYKYSSKTMTVDTSMYEQWVINDLFSSRYAVDYKKNFKFDYSNTKVTDGWEVTTLLEHITTLQAQGKIKDAMYERIRKKIEAAYKTNSTYKLDKEEQQILISQKPLGCGRQWDNYYRGFRNHYVKTSSFPLIEEYTNGTPFDELRKAMEKREAENMFPKDAEGNFLERPAVSKQVRVVFASGIKAGARNVEEIFKYDETPEKNLIGLDTEVLKNINGMELSRNDFGIQTEEAANQDFETNIMSQVNKLLFVGLFEDKTLRFKGGKTAKEMQREKEEIRKKMIDIAADRTAEKLGISLDEDGNMHRVTDSKKFFAQLKKIAKSNGITANEIDSLTVDDSGKVIIPTSFTAAYDKLQPVIMSMIAKPITRVKMQGASYIQVPAAGFSHTKLSDIDQSGVIFTSSYEGRLKYYEKNKDKEKNGRDYNAMQVLIPWPFKEADGKKLNIEDFMTEIDDKNGKRRVIDKNKLPKELLETFGARIPSQSHSSMLPIEIVGFLPENMHDMIVLPDEVTTQTGADYDIDHLYTYFKHYEVVNSNLVATRRYNEELDEDIKFLLAERRVEEDILKKGNNPAALERLNAIEQQLKDLRKQKNRENQPREFNKLQNDYINLHLDMLLNEKVLQKVLAPLDMRDLKDFADKVKAIQEKRSKREFFSSLGYEHNITEYLNNQAGKVGVAIQAVAGTLLANLDGKGIKLRADSAGDRVITIDGLKLTRLGYGTYTMPDGSVRSNSDVINMIMSEAVDNAKNKNLAYLGYNKYNAGVINAMLMLTTDEGKSINAEYVMAMMNQESIIRLMAKIKDKENQFRDTKSYDGLKSDDQLASDLIIKYGETLATLGISEPNLSKRLTEKDMMDALEGKLSEVDNLVLQMKVLQLYTEVLPVATELRKVSKLINIDTNGVGKNVFESVNKEEAIEEVIYNSTVLENLPNMMERYFFEYLNDKGEAVQVESMTDVPSGAEFKKIDTPTEFGHIFNRGLKFANSVLTNPSEKGELLTIAKHESWKAIMKELKEAGGYKKGVPSEVQRKAFRMLRAYLYSTKRGNPLNGIYSSVEAKRQMLIQGDHNTGLKSLAGRIFEYLNKSDDKGDKVNLVGRYFLENLQPVYKVGNGLNEFVEFNMKKYGLGTEKKIVGSMLELATGTMEQQQLLADLAAYSYLTGGAYNPRSFVNTIPVRYLEEIGFTKFLSNLDFNEVDAQEFVEQFLGHEKITRRIKNLKSKASPISVQGEVIGMKFKYKGKEGEEDLDTPKYATIGTDVNENQYILQGFRGEEAIYRVIPRRGKGKAIAEMAREGTDVSIFNNYQHSRSTRMSELDIDRYDKDEQFINNSSETTATSLVFNSDKDTYNINEIKIALMKVASEGKKNPAAAVIAQGLFKMAEDNRDIEKMTVEIVRGASEVHGAVDGNVIKIYPDSYEGKKYDVKAKMQETLQHEVIHYILRYDARNIDKLVGPQYVPLKNLKRQYEWLRTKFDKEFTKFLAGRASSDKVARQWAVDNAHLAYLEDFDEFLTGISNKGFVEFLKTLKENEAQDKNIFQKIGELFNKVLDKLMFKFGITKAGHPEAYFYVQNMASLFTIDNKTNVAAITDNRLNNVKIAGKEGWFNYIVNPEGDEISIRKVVKGEVLGHETMTQNKLAAIREWSKKNGFYYETEIEYGVGTKTVAVMPEQRKVAGEFKYTAYFINSATITTIPDRSENTELITKLLEQADEAINTYDYDKNIGVENRREFHSTTAPTIFDKAKSEVKKFKEFKKADKFNGSPAFQAEGIVVTRLSDIAEQFGNPAIGTKVQRKEGTVSPSDIITVNNVWEAAEFYESWLTSDKYDSAEALKALGVSNPQTTLELLRRRKEFTVRQIIEEGSRLNQLRGEGKPFIYYKPLDGVANNLVDAEGNEKVAPNEYTSHATKLAEIYRDKVKHVEYFKQYLSPKLEQETKKETVTEDKKKEIKSKLTVKNKFKVTVPEGINDTKAITKASIADYYIGFGEDIKGKDGRGSTTEVYRKQIEEQNLYLVNPTKVEPNSVVFVSVAGRRGDASIRKREQDKTIRAALSAIEQGAILVKDSEEKLKDDSYNEGEQRLSANLKAKGYEVMDFPSKGIAVWFNNKGIQPTQLSLFPTQQQESTYNPLEKPIVSIAFENYNKNTPDDKTKGLFFTENLQAYLAARGRLSELEEAKYSPVLNVTSGVLGTNQAVVRMDSSRKRNTNVFAFIVKKRQQAEMGGWLAASGQFTLNDFEQFKKYNTEAIEEALRSRLPLTIPRTIAMGKAALPLELAKWLKIELETKLGILTGEPEVNTTPGYSGYGLKVIGISKIESNKVQSAENLVKPEVLEKAKQLVEDSETHEDAYWFGGKYKIKLDSEGKGVEVVGYYYNGVVQPYKKLENVQRILNDFNSGALTQGRPVREVPIFEDELIAETASKTEDNILNRRKVKIAYTSDQKNALLKIDKFLKGNDKVFLLAGYAGTGKTTLVENIVNSGVGTVSAPTNKAVKVIADKLKGFVHVDAATLHSLMYKLDPDSGRFILSPKLKGTGKILIDEASMIDTRMLNDLLKVIGRGKIIFLGDGFQLPPVGNNPDLFNSTMFGDNKVEMTKVMRTASSNLLDFATYLRSVKKHTKIDDAINDIQDSNLSVAKSRGEALSDVVAMNKRGDNVTYITFTNANRINANKLIRAGLGKNNVIYPDDTLMALSNTNAAKNGEVTSLKELGITGDIKTKTIEVNYRNSLKGTTSKETVVLVRDDVKVYALLPYTTEASMSANDLIDSLYEYKDSDIEEFKNSLSGTMNEANEIFLDGVFTYGYAITAHKSQGSQWDHVYVDQDFLTKSDEDNARWLYTAITRAAKSAVIVQTNNTNAVSISKMQEAISQFTEGADATSMAADILKAKQNVTDKEAQDKLDNC